MRVRFSTWIAAAALTLATAACNDTARSPVGTDVPPGGVFEGGLQSLVVSDFERATDYTIFPSRRADGDRLVTALAWPMAPGVESRALVRFVVAESDSALAATELLGARLELNFLAPEEPVSFALHRVTSEWAEEAATWERRLLGAPWASPGGDFAPEPVARFTIEPGEVDSTGVDSLDVDLPLELIGAWRADTVDNFGFALVQETPGARVQFESRGPGGINVDGPRLVLELRILAGGNPIQESTIRAREDTFIAIDRDPLGSEGGLLAAAGDPVSRAFLLPDLGSIPPGATVVDARLVLTVEAAEVPVDSLSLVALAAVGPFRGEKTIFGSPNAPLGRAAVAAAVQPGDTVSFTSEGFANLVRLWARAPETNDGIGILVFDEEDEFGAVRFFGPDAPADVRPRIRVRTLPPPEVVGDGP